MADNCSICLTPLTQGDLAIQDGCRHIHHDECVRGWLATRSPRRWSCPICRRKIKSIQTISNFHLPEEELNGQVAVNVEPQVHPEVPQEGGRNENDGNVGQEEPEVVILDPPSPPSVPRPAIIHERNQENSGRVEASARNQAARVVIRPVEYMNPTYGSQSIAVPVQGQHSQIQSSGSLVVLQPVSFSPNPGPSTGAQFGGNPGISILHPRQSPQASGSQHGAASHNQNISGTPGSAILSLNSGNDTTFVCPTCHLGFRLRNSLYRHMHRAHQSRLECPSPICNRTFTDRSRLRRHLNREHVE